MPEPKQHLAIGRHGIDSFSFKQHRDTQFPKLTNRLHAVRKIPSKSGDAFRHNHINFPFGNLPASVETPVCFIVARIP